jgi:hypothetical protein
MIVLATAMDVAVAVHVVDGDKIVSDDKCCGFMIGGEIEKLGKFSISFPVWWLAMAQPCMMLTTIHIHGRLPRHLETTQTRFQKPS